MRPYGTVTNVSGAVWLWTLAGLGAGAGALLLAAAPTRWAVAALGALAIAIFALASSQPRRVLLGLFVLSFQLGLVLYLTPPLPPGSTGASWPTSLSIPVPAIAAMVTLLFAGRRRWVMDRGILAAAVLLLLTTAVSVVQSPVRFAGFCHAVLWLTYFAVFFAALNTLQEAEDLRFALRLLSITLAVQSFVYFVQFGLGGTFTLAGEWRPWSGEDMGRYGGTISTHPAAFASFVLPLLLLAAAEFLAGRTGKTGLLLAGSLTLLLTLTRAAWIGFGLGLLYLLAAGRRLRLLSPRRIWLTAALLAAALAITGPLLAGRLKQDHRAALEERWTLSVLAWRLVHAQPITGVGAGAYPVVLHDYLTPELADQWLWVVHNVYLLRAAETGLPGLAAWLFFLVAAFRQASPGRIPDPALRPAALGIRAGLVALSWEMLWDVSLGPSATCLLWFLAGWVAAARRVVPRGDPA
jgi:hypothetical protein